MASNPKTTSYLNVTNSAFTNIPATMFGVRLMEIEEVNTAGNSYNPQGLQYQLWDPSLVATPGAVPGGFGPTLQSPPGDILVIGDGNTVIGNVAQPANWAGTRGADVPVKIMSATGTATQVNVREYVRKVVTN